MSTLASTLTRKLARDKANKDEAVWTSPSTQLIAGKWSGQVVGWQTPGGQDQASHQVQQAQARLYTRVGDQTVLRRLQ